MEVAAIASQPKHLRQDCKGSPSNPDKFLEDGPHHEDSVKRHKPYNSILNLLDDNDDDGEQQPSNQDLSAMFTTLQRELAASPSPDDHNQQQPPRVRSSTEISDDDVTHLYYIDLETETYGGSSVAMSADEGDKKARSLMRDLLEAASDDELGIPNYINNGNDNDINIKNTDQRSEENMVSFGFNGDHGFWEIEDEAANYNTVLQSQLFM